ncbi:MAG: hypothetical protein GY765_07970, partial [bacterium]|nr:hypothetical protein [bacterium]
MKKSDVKAIYALSPMQEGMLFYSMMKEDSSAYFEQMALSVSGPMNAELLEKTVNLLIEKYDVLRTIFTYKKTRKPRQILLKKRAIKITFEDIGGLSGDAQAEYFENFK